MYIGGGGHFSIRGVTFLYWKSDPGVNFPYGKVTHGSHFHRVTSPYDTGTAPDPQAPLGQGRIQAEALILGQESKNPRMLL